MTAQTYAPKTILIVDGDSENREFLKHEFETRGFTVSEAEDTTQAFEKLGQQIFKAVLIDLELSRRERSEFITKAQSEKFGSPVVVLLVAASSMTREDAYDQGAVATFSKPFDPVYLTSRVEELLIPAPVRWKAKRARSVRHSISLKVDQLNLGRGGFALKIGPDTELFEGESVAFDLEVNEQDKWTLRGTGVVRYIHLANDKRRQEGWGIEFESLDDPSFERVMTSLAKRKPHSYIPRTLH